MKSNKKGFSIDKTLKDRIKDIINDSKKRNLIKPHTEAFRDYPVKNECGNGKLDYYMK